MIKMMMMMIQRGRRSQHR